MLTIQHLTSVVRLPFRVAASVHVMTRTIVAIALYVFPRDNVSIKIILSRFLILAFLLHLLGGVIICVFSCGNRVASKARIQNLTFISIHVEAIIHITLMLLSRLASGIL